MAPGNSRAVRRSAALLSYGPRFSYREGIHQQYIYIYTNMKNQPCWSTPYITAPGNSRAVRRSAALLSYGPRFSYREGIHQQYIYEKSTMLVDSLNYDAG
jgi:hypothetical protein